MTVPNVTWRRAGQQAGRVAREPGLLSGLVEQYLRSSEQLARRAMKGRTNVRRQAGPLVQVPLDASQALVEKIGRTNPPWPAEPMPQSRQTGGTGLSPARERALAMQAIRMYKTHLDLGWSPAASAAWAANIVDESGGDPHITEQRGGVRSDRPSGHGLFQVTHPARRRMFEQAMGIPVEQSTENQQLKFRDIELDKVPQFRALAESPRGPGTAGDMADSIARIYENPANAAAEAVDRRNIANEILALRREWRQARNRPR